MILEELALELVTHGPDISDRAVSSLIRAVPSRSTVECVHFELKREFSPSPRAWAELSKDIVALANSGGGVILFGIDDNGRRRGLPTSLLSVLDPARVTDQLRRKAPSASVATAYLERTYYKKLYGVMVVQPLRVPLVFDTEWGYDGADGKHRMAIKPGLMYVRTPGKSAPARQADVREVWQRSVDLAMEKTMARIEQVASLPLDSDLIITDDDNPTSGFLLVDKGEGRPVQIVSDPDTPAVRLREVLAPDVPYASVTGEVASQVRLWQQADQKHVVSRHTLIRWWLEREDLNLDATSAEFCLLSAGRSRGFPMYWASRLEPARLREILDRELHEGSAIPCQAYAYVVGVFFWEQRHEILHEEHMDHLSAAPWRAVEKVTEADSKAEFLASVRWQSRLWPSSEAIAMSELLEDHQRAVEIFTKLLQADLDGTITPSEAGFARQLDMVVHAPI